MKKNNSGLNLVILKNYCDHFGAIQPSKIPPIKKLACNICRAPPPNTWICLSKGCGSVVCGKNKYKHMQEHNEQYKFKHPIYLNSTTTEIRCVACNIQILDFDQMPKQQYENIKDQTDPLVIRRRFTKKDNENSLFKNGGNIENSEAHRKNSQGICTLLSKTGETAISSVIQFFSNIRFLRDVLRVMRVEPFDENSKLLEHLVNILNKIWSGDVRIMSINEFESIVGQCLSSYMGYSRKNPLQLFTLLFNIIHDTVKFTYHLPEGAKERETVPDEWEMLKGEHHQHSIMKTNLCSNMTYKLKCTQCKENKQIQGEVYKLELEIPKMRRESKVLEEEFQRHKFQSPLKHRKKSLVERFFKKQVVIPVSLPELIINYIKTKFPTSKQLKTCHKCKKEMTPLETKFSKLPNLLLIIIHNNQKDPSEIVERTRVEFSTQRLDMAGFVEENYKGETQYEFQAAICEKDFQYATIVKNKHVYQFMNDTVKINIENLAPYVLCYAIKNPHSVLYRNVKSNVKIEISPDFCLPNFWLQELKHFQPYSLVNPLICKHSKLKAFQNKLTKYNYVPKPIYEALVEKFGGRMYSNQKCYNCSCEAQSLAVRRRKQKQYISKLDGYRCKVYFMVSCEWLNRWTDYLYKKRDDQYIIKGNPEPGPIDNGPIWEAGKFKENLKKGEDFKLLNYYVWSFFKQLYGGGPQIQYKSKSEDKSRIHQLCDGEVIVQIKEKVKELKQLMREDYYLDQQWVESPVKKRIPTEQNFKQFTSSKES